MSAIQIVMLVIIVLIIVPMPLAWLIGTLFPNGYTQAHTQRMSELFRKEWKRILLCGAVIILLLLALPRDNAITFVLLALAVLAGRLIAVSRNNAGR